MLGKLRQDALSSRPGYIGKILSQKEEEEEEMEGGGGDGGRKRRRKGGRERLGLYQGSVSLLLLPVRLFRRHCLLFPWLPQSSRLSFQLQNEDNEDEDATKAKHKFPTLF